MDTDTINAISPIRSMTGSPAKTAVAEAISREQETTEQLAQGGDTIADAQLADEVMRHIPISAQVPQPLPMKNLTVAHEVGKGELIDIYD